MADQEARKQFNAAVEAIQKTPGDLDRWDEIESLVETLNCPDEVAKLYKAALTRRLSSEDMETLGERGAAFMEEWFGDDPAMVRDLLTQALDIDPEAAWAFQRLTQSFTAAESWNDVLALYDRTIAAISDEERRILLLDEAAQVAKDIANLPDKAIAYLQQLVPLKRDDVQLEHSLERLLERHERWVDLIQLWQSKLPALEPEERDQSRVRIAACWLDNLSDPGKALEAVKPLLTEPRENDRDACEILERIVTFSSATAQVRHSALDLLRIHYESTDRPREIVRVLEAAIDISAPEESLSLREEAGARLAALDEDVAAMNHYASLLALDPGHVVVQERMLALARRSGEFARYAAGIAIAANACTDIPRKVALLAEAARIRLDMLEDEEGAIELFQAAMSQEGLPPDDEPRVARRLAELLARAERPRERLQVLERLARIESTPSTRRTVIGEAARLAESLGETDRALDLWQSRIDADANDLFALDAMIVLLESNERWQPLIDSLRLRVGKATADSQRRADLVHIAVIYDQALGAPEQAIDAWLRVQSECGENAETVDALADLLTRTGRWSDLAELLERASDREIARVTERLVKLADAYRAHLGAPDRALTGYRNALTIDARHEAARAGLTALLDVDGCGAEAAAALVDIYRRSEEWARFLELLGPRLDSAKDPREQLGILREAAEIQERQMNDLPAALSSVARAFPLAPKDRVLEGHLMRLAGATDQWELAARTYHLAAAAMDEDRHEQARLRFAEARLYEERLDRAGEAHQAYMAVLGSEPGNLAAAQAAVRIGTRLGRWDDAATATIAYIQERGAIEPTLVQELALVAGQGDAYDDAAAALGRALGDGAGMPARVAFELHRTLAIWNRDRRGDEAAAEASLRSALSFEPGRADMLRDLADLQRKRPGQSLYATLRTLADADPRDLDVVKEAAELALEHLSEPADQLQALTTLLGRATAAWRGTSDATGQREPDAYVRWALDRLIELYTAAGNPAAAVDLLVDSSRLPFDADTRRAMRHRAAEIAAAQMNDKAVAIEMYRGVLSQAPGDTVAMERLGELYEADGRMAENLALKRLQLNVEKDPERRLSLRLEIARLVGEIERHGGRMEALRKNLDEHPGHLASVDALSALLEAQGETAELLELLEEQARRVEERQDKPVAATLWGKAARVAEHHTKEPDRAIASYRRVVELAPTSESLRALAELYMERNQPALAVPWFENLLASVPPADRPGVVHQLARAHLGARQTDRAIASLESHIDDQTPALELRSLLAELYREGENWEALARLLTSSLPLLADREATIAYAREAADIYTRVLKSPNKAIPALERALAIMPGDRTLRTQLGIGLRHAGRLEDARDRFLEIIDEFGRRRSPERAAVHVELALVYQALGEDEKALQEMEQASKMDTNNVDIQRRLAELAREAGNLDKAERTYRSLLLVVRRNPPGDDVESVGPSEVLYELHKLAQQRGEDEQATELLETALETAVQNDAEVRRLRRSLLAHKQAETLLRVIDMRLEASEGSASQAELLADKAEVLHGSLGRSGDAVETLIQAIRLMPMRDDLHRKARALAKAGPGVVAYTDAVTEIADSMRRKEDPPIVAHLLLRAGDTLEHDAGDLEAALELYKRVEELGERKAEAYYAIARVAGTTGDTDEQARVLEAMLALATADEPSHAQIDALYRLAEIFVGNPERRAQGVELLEQAFAAEPRYAQAGRILKVAAAADAEDTRVMGLYERVARAGNSWEMLLDFLERRASLPSATPSQVREAVNVAVEHEQHDRAEALLSRAVEAARRSDEGLAGAVWALSGLAERHIAMGDLQGARDLIHEIAGFADPAEVSRLALELARTAQRSDKALAADMYEFLRERDPMDRRVWEPLVELYRELGDSDRLQAVIAATLPTLMDPTERNTLRMQHARYLIERLERNQDAVEVLRDVLLDDPDHRQASALLEDVLRKEGDQEALADFLWQRFEEARTRGNPETITEVAGRLGALLDSMGSGEAVAVYKAALEVAPESLELLRTVLAHLDQGSDPRERAGIMERLIVLEEPARAAELAASLCTLWEELEDADGYQRALELGHQASPDDAGLHQRLEMWYRDNQQWAELARLMSGDAERLAGRDQQDAAVSRLREAASVYRDTIGDTRAAAEVLAKARKLAPANDSLVAELAACLNAGGDTAGAIAAIGEALDQDIQGPPRVDLLLLRSDLRMHLGQEEPGIADLEEAHGLDPERIRPQLIQSLDTRRLTAQKRGDRDAERASTMRLAMLLAAAGQSDEQRALLYQWMEREPSDREPLYALRDMDKEAENWEGVVSVCSRLVAIEEGELQAQAALDLAEAAELAGRPGDAQGGLEMVHRAQPGNERIRNRLRRIYELAGSHRELAAILLADGDHADEDELRYASYRRAAEVLVYQLGDAAAAIEPARKAKEMKAGDHDALILYVDVLIASGRTDEAIGILEPAIGEHKRRSPQLAALQQRMAQVAAALGDRDSQLGWLKKAFDVDRKNGEIAGELARLATDMGDYDLALKPLRAITLMENPGPVTRVMALLWEAKIEHARGNRAKAELWAKKALREDPEYDEAKEFLDQISN